MAAAGLGDQLGPAVARRAGSIDHLGQDPGQGLATKTAWSRDHAGQPARSAAPVPARPTAAGSARNPLVPHDGRDLVVIHLGVRTRWNPGRPGRP